MPGVFGNASVGTEQRPGSGTKWPRADPYARHISGRHMDLPSILFGGVLSDMVTLIYMFGPLAAALAVSVIAHFWRRRRFENGRTVRLKHNTSFYSADSPSMPE